MVEKHGNDPIELNSIASKDTSLHVWAVWQDVGWVLLISSF